METILREETDKMQTRINAFCDVGALKGCASATQEAQVESQMESYTTTGNNALAGFGPSEYKLTRNARLANVGCHVGFRFPRLETERGFCPGICRLPACQCSTILHPQTTTNKVLSQQVYRRHGANVYHFGTKSAVYLSNFAPWQCRDRSVTSLTPASEPTPRGAPTAGV